VVWTISWGLFLGSHAHGVHDWWEHVQLGGLFVLVPLAFLRSSTIWRRRGPPTAFGIATLVLSQVGMVLVVFLSTWLSFQMGLALHEPPGSLSNFLWNKP
jgi:hypothetical protein